MNDYDPCQYCDSSRCIECGACEECDDAELVDNKCKDCRLKEMG